MSVQQRRKYDKDFERNAVRLTEEAGRINRKGCHHGNEQIKQSTKKMSRL